MSASSWLCRRAAQSLDEEDHVNDLGGRVGVASWLASREVEYRYTMPVDGLGVRLVKRSNPANAFGPNLAVLNRDPETSRSRGRS